MPSVKRFLELHSRKLLPKTTLRMFLQRKGVEVKDDEVSGNFAYRIVFLPERGRERISFAVVEKNGTVRSEYTYQGLGKTASLVEPVERRLVSHLDPYKVPAKNRAFYPVLDLSDDRLARLRMYMRDAPRPPLKGKKEVVVILPKDEFVALKRDVLSHKDISIVLDAVEKALKGKHKQLNEFQRGILKMTVAALVRTNGRAILPLRKLSDDEKEMVAGVMEKYLKLGSRARRKLMDGLRTHFKKVEDVDEATRNFHAFLKMHGIRASPSKIRAWIEMMKK